MIQNETCTLLLHFLLNLMCLFSWIWLLQCFLQGWGGGGLKYNGSCFFGNQFIHYLKKCEALVEGKGINVFRIRKVSVVYALD
jgi:hypothetical protein